MKKLKNKAMTASELYWLMTGRIHPKQGDLLFSWLKQIKEAEGLDLDKVDYDYEHCKHDEHK